MSGPVTGAASAHRANRSQSSETTTIVREGQTPDDIARDRGVGERSGRRSDGTTTSKSRPRGKAIDLHPERSQNSVDDLLRASPSKAMQVRADVPAGMDPRLIDQEFALGLAKKSPEELRAWYQNSTDAMKSKLKSVIWKMGSSTLTKSQRSDMKSLIANLNDLQTVHNRDWATQHYGKLDDRQLLFEVSNTKPQQLMEDLRNLSTGGQAANLVRKRMVEMIEIGMRTQTPRTSPLQDLSMVSAGDIMDAAHRLKGPGSAAVKAEMAGAMFRRTAGHAANLYRYPKKPAGRGVDTAVYKARTKKIDETRAAWVKERLVKEAPHYARLLESDPAGVVREMENISRNPGNARLMPEVFTAIAKHEYGKDPKKGGEALGRIVGAVATDYAREVSEKDPNWTQAKARGNDLGTALAAAEIAIDNVATSEREKIAFGAKIVGFAVDTLKDSGIPGAEQIGKAGGKAIAWQQKFENGEVNRWQRGIQESFEDIIRETYDNVGYFRGHAPESREGRIHENGQDVYETTYQEGYRNVKEAYGG